MSDADHFLLAVCQIGAERALKQEVMRAHADLRAAFARPGLVTWKDMGHAVPPDFELEAVFARAYAAALGPAGSVGEAAAMAERVRAGRRMRLHVWERDVFRPGAEPAAGAAKAAENARAEAARAALLAGYGALFLDGDVAFAGDHVLDVVVAEGEPMFLGHHIHSRLHSPFPGGRIPVEVPEEAPSRAYRKLEEAISWSGAALQAGQVAVEIGSAPGGASQALLRRGLHVVGIDPGAMDAAVLSSPRFRHVRMPMAAVGPADLPPRVDWLLLDVNLAPQVSLHGVRGIVSALRPSLRGLLFTLKLNDWKMADEVPDLLRRIAGMGMTEVRATQLPGNRREIFAYATPGGERPEQRRRNTATRAPRAR